MAEGAPTWQKVAEGAPTWQKAARSNVRTEHTAAREPLGAQEKFEGRVRSGEGARSGERERERLALRARR